MQNILVHVIYKSIIILNTDLNDSFPPTMRVNLLPREVRSVVNIIFLEAFKSLLEGI